MVGRGNIFRMVQHCLKNNLMKLNLLIITVFLISCSSTTNKNNTTESDCTEMHKLQKLIYEVINLPEFQQYYSIQKVIGQNHLVIEKNDMVNDSINLNKFELPVLFILKEEIETQKIKAYLEFKELKIKGDSASVYFRYDIQGVGCKIIFSLHDCSWKIENVDLWEN